MTIGKQDFVGIASIEIVARRDLNADTVLLGLRIRMRDGSTPELNWVLKFSRQNGEWRFDPRGP